MVYGIKFETKKEIKEKQATALKNNGSTIITRSGVMDYYLSNGDAALTVVAVLEHSRKSAFYDFEIITVPKEKVAEDKILKSAKEFFAKEKGQSFSDTIVVK